MNPSTILSLAGAAALVLAPMTARADAVPVAASTVHVQVTGADPGAIADAVAVELGVPTIGAGGGGTCPSPCVTVAVGADARATIAVTTARGVVERTVPMPSDPAAATETIALMVGNLARDEAGALLASLAPPPAPSAVTPAITSSPAIASAPSIAAPPAITTPPTSPTPAVEAPIAAPRGPATAYGFGLVPPLAFGVDRSSAGGLLVDLVIGSHHRVASFHLAGVASVVTGELRGVEIAGAASSVGAIDGTQVAGAIARAGSVHGAQVAGAVAVVGELEGTQVAGAITTARSVYGTQLAGALAVTGRLDGTQVSGAINVAGRVRGLQVAGAVNVAGRVDGTQVSGAINIADELRGVQVGVINVARGGDGVSIGLINLVRGGRTEVEATVDQAAVGTIVLRHGSQRWHNVYGLGGHVEGALVDDRLTGDDVWMAGFGMGPNLHRGATTVDLELMGWNVVYGGRFGDHLDLLGQLRVVASHRFGAVGVVGGAAFNTYVTTDPRREGLLARTTEPATDGARVLLWPSLFVGLRL